MGQGFRWPWIVVTEDLERPDQLISRSSGRLTVPRRVNSGAAFPLSPSSLSPSARRDPILKPEACELACAVPLSDFLS